jgi:hypothetical protein
MSTVAYGQDHLWRTLYKAAILEPDPTETPRRIAEAETEIVHRARELFQETGNKLAEEQALDSAIRSLHLFRSTLKKGAASCRHDPRLLTVANSK